MNNWIRGWAPISLHLMRKPNYDEGLKTRYDNAMKEFRNNAVKSLKITNDYVDENIHRLESKATIEPKYVDGSLRLLCLPKWRLEVFGEDYIVLATSEFKHNNAWIMPEKESRELDLKLRRIIASYHTERQITIDDISRLESEKRIQMSKAIDTVIVLVEEY